MSFTPFGFVVEPGLQNHRGSSRLFGWCFRPLVPNRLLLAGEKMRERGRWGVSTRRLKRRSVTTRLRLSKVRSRTQRSCSLTNQAYDLQMVDWRGWYTVCQPLPRSLLRWHIRQEAESIAHADVSNSRYHDVSVSCWRRRRLYALFSVLASNATKRCNSQV